jgi:hypothetical protein
MTMVIAAVNLGLCGLESYWCPHTVLRKEAAEQGPSAPDHPLTPQPAPVTVKRRHAALKPGAGRLDVRAQPLRRPLQAATLGREPRPHLASPRQQGTQRVRLHLGPWSRGGPYRRRQMAQAPGGLQHAQRWRTRPPALDQNGHPRRILAARPATIGGTPGDSPLHLGDLNPDTPIWLMPRCASPAAPPWAMRTQVVLATVRARVRRDVTTRAHPRPLTTCGVSACHVPVTLAMMPHL